MAEQAPRAGWWRLLRRLAPWLVAAAILAVLLARVPRSELAAALERSSLPLLVLAAVGFVTGTLAADGLAVWLALRRAIPGSGVGLAAAVIMRGATYLLQLVSWGAGQGGLVYFLRRYRGIPVAAGTGAVLLGTGVFLIVVAGSVGLGLGLGAAPDRPELRWLAVVVAVGVPVYLGLVWLRPRVLARISFLAPLFDAGVVGTLQVAAARAVHMAVLIGGHSAAMWLFGIEVPLEAAIARLPVLFLVGSLPVSPSGLGTTQAAAVTLFVDFAPGASAEAREAAVLAYSLAFQVLSSGAMAACGLACLRLLDRTTPLTPDDETA